MNTVIIENKTNRNAVDLEFKKISWTLAARVKKDITRMNLTGCKVNDGILVSTDGHRMHICYTENEIPNGVYTVKSINAKLIILEEIDAQFPDYERVIPKINKESQHKLTCNGFDGWFLKEAYIMAGNEGFNPTYLHEAYIHDSVVYMQKEPGFKPLLGYNDRFDQAFVVMPLKGSD